MPMNPLRAFVAEFVGSAFLLLAIVGSGIMAQRLCGGNMGLALLANALATGGALVHLILAFGPISGAHLNPAVSVAAAMRGELAWPHVPGYLAAQCAGAIAGVVLANLTFALPMFTASTHARDGVGMFASEIIATFGLLTVIFGVGSTRATAVPYAVAAYIVGAYWFTPSTSFANPAVAIARSMTDTFAGIAPRDVPTFILAETIGAVTATILFAWLPLRDSSSAATLVRQIDVQA
jgi:glycerol uptake facilitator-like aquaporin